MPAVVYRPSGAGAFRRPSIKARTRTRSSHADGPPEQHGGIVVSDVLLITDQGRIR